MEWWATAADVATVVLAALAIVATVWVAIAQHRATGPRITVQVAYFANWGMNELDDPGGWVRGTFLGTVREGRRWQAGWEEQYAIEPFLRVIVTNVGRMPVGVEDVAWRVKRGLRTTHTRGVASRHRDDIPFELSPQQRRHEDVPLIELRSSSTDGTDGTVRPVQFFVQLSNGKTVVNRKRVNMKPPKRVERFSAEPPFGAPGMQPSSERTE